ncbi:MAG: putative rane protein [Clostridia bacterium]|jgi:uncharacterized repeat protein (TIGR03987 family)|nr:putative rane protein [Clostridia bacterium]
MLLYAIIFINLAFVFYTVGVWSEKIQKKLKGWHLVVFGIGLIFDTLGTSFMAGIAKNGFSLDFHGITGILAIALMLIHVIWAAWVMFSNNKKMQLSFHKLSFIVWIIWLIPFISGAVYSMMK